MIRDHLEGLDPTAEAETDVTDLEDLDDEEVAGAHSASAPDHAAMQRALRELEAAKARVQRDAERAAQELREKLVLELLPVIDNLDRTIRAAAQSPEARAAPGVIEGVRLVRTQFMQVLERYGIRRVEARHQPFDPAIHEAIGTAPVAHPGAHNVVVDQIEPGYRYEGRLLRPAKVIVGRHVSRYH
jgi:molecular chaperone GrpE